MFTEPVQNRKDKKEATRARVLESADRLFREQGYESTTVRDIAADAAVSVGTVMAVGDKESLLVSVFDEWITTVHRDRQLAATATSSPKNRHDAPAAIFDLIVPFIAHFARDPALSSAYASIIVGGNHQSVIFRNLALSLVTEIESELGRAGFAAVDAARGARVIYFAYIGIIMSGNNSASSTDSPVQQLKDVIAYVVHPPEGERTP